MFYRIGMRVIWLMTLMIVVYHGWLVPFLKWQGRDFPSKSEIQYSEGKFYLDKISSTSRSSSAATETYLIENGKKVEYYCGYSAYHMRSIDICFGEDDKRIRSYIGKTVRVGWYYQKDFLWLHNPHR